MLWAHEGVVEALMSGGPVLPTRFGTSLGGEADLCRLLVARRAPLRRALREVRGCVELGVRVAGEGEGDAGQRAGAAGAATGEEYLGSLMEGRRRDRETTAAVHEPLSRLARAATEPAARDGVLTAAYLVEAQRVAEFAGRVVALQEAHPALDISCTGPWPPYSFAEGRN
jgi:hypothetical protein